MLSIREEPDVAVVTVAGKLKAADYETFVPALEAILRRRGKVPMLIDATALEDWELAALWEDVKLDIEHMDSFGPMAVVGDKRWHEWGTWFAKPFIRAEMQYFPAEEIGSARAWLLRARQRQEVR